MAEIVIKKTIRLGFLGEKYKDDYLVFKAVPVKDFESLMEKTPDSNIQATKFICKVLKDKFIEGKFQGETVNATDIDSFDGITVSECFAILTGQKLDPKD